MPLVLAVFPVIICNGILSSACHHNLWCPYLQTLSSTEDVWE